MPLSKTPGSYADIKPILDAALAAGGGRYRPSIHPVRWTQRAYMYRSLLRKYATEAYAALPGLIPSTPYDHMILRVDGDAVVIQFVKPDGELTGPDGQVIDYNAVKPKDDLEEAAAAFAAELQGQ